MMFEAVKSRMEDCLIWIECWVFWQVQGLMGRNAECGGTGH